MYVCGGPHQWMARGPGVARDDVAVLVDPPIWKSDAGTGAMGDRHTESADGNNNPLAKGESRGFKSRRPLDLKSRSSDVSRGSRRLSVAHGALR